LRLSSHSHHRHYQLQY